MGLVFPGAPAALRRIQHDPTKGEIGRTLLAETGQPAFLDVGAVTRAGEDYYYLRGISLCSRTPGP